jgi:hypothetical protein
MARAKRRRRRRRRRGRERMKRERVKRDEDEKGSISMEIPPPCVGINCPRAHVNKRVVVAPRLVVSPAEKRGTARGTPRGTPPEVPQNDFPLPGLLL